MSKSFSKKQGKTAKIAERKVTDFFARKSATSTSASTSQPTSSPPGPVQTPFTMTTRSRQSGGSPKTATQAKATISAGAKGLFQMTSTSSSHIPISSDYAALSPLSSTKRRSVMLVAEQEPSRTTRRSANAPISARPPLKRPHSPEDQERWPQEAAPKTPNKRKKKFEIDLDADIPEATIYVNKSGSPLKVAHTPGSALATPPKAPNSAASLLRTSGTAFSPSSQSVQPLLSTSQSDEMELVLPVPRNSDIGQVKEHVRKWRQEAVASPNPYVDKDWIDSGAEMDVVHDKTSPTPDTPPDALSSYATSPFHSEADVSAQLRTRSTSASSLSPESPLFSSTSLPSPPNTKEVPPTPATPEALDSHTKTAQLIASIKAKAYAASVSSSDGRHSPLQFRELEDSDDEDLDILPSNQLKGAKKFLSLPQSNNDTFSSPLSSAPSSSHKTSYNLRNHKTTAQRSPPVSPTRSARTSSRATRTRNAAAARLPTVLTKDNASKPHRKKAAPNPLDVLLREKKAADKRGNSEAAFRRAEDAANYQPRMLLVASDDEPGDSVDAINFADESAAWKAVQAGTTFKLFSPAGGSGAAADHSSNEDVILGTRETNILGSKAGQAISKILVSDKSNKSKAKAEEIARAKALGVQLWNEAPHDERMDVDPTKPGEGIDFGHASTNPIVALLQRLSKSGAFDQMCLLLNSGIIGNIPSNEVNEVVSPLFKLALSASDNVLADSAQNALVHLWHHNSRAWLSFADVASALCDLDARPDVAQELHWPVQFGTVGKNVGAEARGSALYRLSNLLEAAALVGCVPLEDIPDIVLSLLLVGLDTSTTNELRMQLNIAINSLCQSVELQAPGAETALVRKLVEYASSLTPVNKAHLLSFLGSGSGRTRRISQWLAYALLVEEPVKATDGMPPISKLIDVLSPPAGSGLLFDVNSDSTDYEDLGHYVSIVSAAFADIDPYVYAERELKQSTATALIEDSPRKSRKLMMPLEVVRNALELIHGKIVDTRAAHLDRSRTKAALQRLYMRIYYQREATLKSGSKGQTSNIRLYFSPRS
ncbi:hypothetical protein BV22DRAFT_1127611 [Leucogyrophana mollusca]|uniref:Uncharacterized protein n=1 Tax=Leucogyrophana mollusca TaxID=85980 RepID=A0ACB8BNC6_9AGAM|nr:hypothetical protein BV22DRAFT_1127611 [Leucogyrophana mollusca]